MTKTNETHAFSAFALDVYVAAGKKTGSAALQAHLVTCERCKTYVAGLDAVANEAPPAWDSTRLGHPTRARSRYLLAGAIGSGLALAAAVVLLARSPRDSIDETYVGVKGAPAVQVLVRRDGRAQIWDGRESVRPGDALALRASCEGFTHVTVATPGREPGTWARLEDRACPSDGAPLPFSLIVDEQPGDERMVVVLSDAPLDDHALGSAVSETRRTRGVWVIPFVFAKNARNR